MGGVTVGRLGDIDGTILGGVEHSEGWSNTWGSGLHDQVTLKMV